MKGRMLPLALLSLAAAAGYAQEETEEWLIDLSVLGNGPGEFANCTFGQLALATDGLEARLGEFELPPPPPPGLLDARFVLPGGVQVSRDFRSTADAAPRWEIVLQPGASGYPLTIVWEASGLPEKKNTLTGGEDGSRVAVDMRQAQEYILTDQTSEPSL